MEKLPKINIIYEDNHLLVVEKPINIPVQEDITKDKDLLTILKSYIKDKSNKPGNVYLGLVHRLDRTVGGVMVFAKTSKAASRLNEQIRNKTFKKTYYAIVENKINSEGKLIDYLEKDERNNITKISIKGLGKESILEYTIIDTINNLNLIKINLITGRSHQIRVQFSSRNNPLYGDKKYNKNCEPNSNIALIAKSISFIHPTLKKELYFELNMPNNYPWSLFKKEK